MARGGKREGAGRKAGVPNKLTSSVKQSIQAVYEARGGDDALMNWAEDNRTEFYRLWGRLLPTEVSGPDGADIGVRQINEIVVRGVRPNADD